MRRFRRLAAAAAPALLLAVAPGALGAQCRPGDPNCRPGPTPVMERHGWEGHAAVLGLNAAAGGLTAGVLARARGGSFWRGFAAGAAGGSAVYAGKRLSAEGFWGAGLAGRQVASVGSSVIRNASEERDALARVVLSAGPVRLHLDRDEGWSPRPRLDLIGAGMLAWRAAAAESRLDLGASLSAGAPVFRTKRAHGPGWHGNNSAGVILLRDDYGTGAADELRRMVFAHERVHTPQYDQALLTLGEPAEAWLLRRVPGGRHLHRHVDVGLIVIPNLLLNAVIPYEDRPWEREAHFFSGTP